MLTEPIQPHKARVFYRMKRFLVRWGRLSTCGGLVIRLLGCQLMASRVKRWADPNYFAARSIAEIRAGANFCCFASTRAR